MAQTLLFDRQRYIDTLREGGMIDEVIARRHAAALESAMREAVVTQPMLEAGKVELKTDISELRHEMKSLEIRLDARIDQLDTTLNGRIDRLDTSVTGRIDAAKYEILKWMIGGQIGLFALLRIFK